MAVVNLKDLLTPEEKARVEQRYKERTTRQATGAKVAPEMWIIATLGVYLGWGAVEAVKRGYIESFEKNGDSFEKVLVPFTLDEALMLIDAADAVHNQMTAKNQSATYYATAGAFSKEGFSALEKDLKKRSEIAFDE